MTSMPPRRPYWRTNLRWIAGLLAVWFGVTFGVGAFARELNFGFFGWPLGWWMASQGALIVYCAIVWIYARAMNRLDDDAGHRHD